MEEKIFELLGEIYEITKKMDSRVDHIDVYLDDRKDKRYYSVLGFCGKDKISNIVDVHKFEVKEKAVCSTTTETQTANPQADA